METCRLIVFLICSLVWPCTCNPRRLKCVNTRTFHRTGEAIALDSLIQKYEKDHRTFYEKEIKNGNYFKWPTMYNKNLSDYCRKYLDHCVPTRRRNPVVTGVEIRRSLHYKIENAGAISDVTAVQCKIMYNHCSVMYYLTRAPEPNCVYALKCSGSLTARILTIINKYCDFETNESTNNALKRKWEESFSTMHCRTRQPVAKYEYLLKYELEHQELLKRVGEQGNCIEWPHAVEHPNLDNFCYQYMSNCAPSRDRESVVGIWKTQELHYQILNRTEDIHIIIVSCVQFKGAKRQYHITRALESNCVYALLRLGSNAKSPMIIVFKHCDFEHLNNQQTISQDYDKLISENVIQKHEIREEKVNTLETMHIFPH